MKNENDKGTLQGHTAGPWRYHLGRGANPRFHVQDTGGYQVASTTELNRHPQAHEENAMREANARLIAAAPELLEALERVIAWASMYRDSIAWESGKRDIEQARAAIAKAKGVQS